MIDIEEKLSRTFAFVADSKAIPPVPTAPTVVVSYRRPSRLRRAALICGGTLTFAGVGLGVAAAAGVPLDFGWGDPVKGAYNALPETTRLVATTHDSQGSLQLWVADATDHGYCVAFVRPDTPPPRDRREGGGCSGPVGDVYWNTFGVDGFSSNGVFARHVPGATRVDVVLGDGTGVTMPVGDAWTVGSLTGAQEALHPVLVGYDAAGDVVGRAALSPRP